MTDDQLRRIIILTPSYSDDDTYTYQIRIARRVLAEAHRLEMRRRRDDDNHDSTTTKGKL